MPNRNAGGRDEYGLRANVNVGRGPGEPVRHETRHGLRFAHGSFLRSPVAGAECRNVATQVPAIRPSEPGMSGVVRVGEAGSGVCQSDRDEWANRRYKGERLWAVLT
jgi:hypothetical protein